MHNADSDEIHLRGKKCVMILWNDEINLKQLTWNAGMLQNITHVYNYEIL